MRIDSNHVVFALLFSFFQFVAISSAFGQNRQLYELGKWSNNPNFSARFKDNYILVNTASSLNLLDISNQSNMIMLNFMNQPPITTGMLLTDSLAYMGGGQLNYFGVVDISNLLPTSILSTVFNVSGTIYQLAKRGDYIYFPTSADTLYVMNVSDPYFPFVAQSIYLGGFASGCVIDGTSLYIGGTIGLRVFDISNGASPIVGITVPGNFTSLVTDTLNRWLIANQNSGFSVYDISSPLLPSFMYFVTTSNSGQGIVSLSYNNGSLMRILSNGLESFEVNSVSALSTSIFPCNAQVNNVEIRDSLVALSTLNEIYLLKYGYVDPTSVNDYNDTDIMSLSPNPAINFIFIDGIDKFGLITFELFNLYGQKIKSGTTTGRISLEAVSDQICVIKLKNGEKEIFSKIFMKSESK